MVARKPCNHFRRRALAGSSSLQEKLRQGIEAARKGDKIAAQRLLRVVVESEPNNEVAWMWLASTLENLQERREALQEALRINPKNTRAQEALKQLEAVLPPVRRSQAARPITGNLPRVGAEGGNTLITIGVAILGLVILAFIIFTLVSRGQPQDLPNAATRVALQSSILNTTVPTATIDPKDYTATPFFGVIVTANNQVILPATFTPTFTPTATATPQPTATPFPASLFTVVYSALSSSDAQPGLFTVSGDGSADRSVGLASDGYTDVAYAPNGQSIAFVRTVTYDKDGQSVTAPELFVAPLDNLGSARQITQLGGSHLASPAWASDSIQLLFVSNLDSDDEIWYITEDGNNLKQMTQSDGVDKDPVWSPDGNLIVFASERANFFAGGSGVVQTQLFSMTPDGATVTQLTSDQGSSYSPAFSPDGTRITFASDRSGSGNIYLMELSGENVRRLTLDSRPIENRQPAFAPNSRNILFLSNRDGENFLFYSMDTRGNNITRLSDPGRNIQSFAYRFMPPALFNP